MKDFLLDLKVFLNCAFESGFRKSGAFIENDNVEKSLVDKGFKNVKTALYDGKILYAVKNDIEFTIVKSQDCIMIKPKNDLWIVKISYDDILGSRSSFYWDDVCSEQGKIINFDKQVLQIDEDSRGNSFIVNMDKDVEKYLYCLLDSFDTYDGFFDKSKFIIFYTNS